MIDRWTPGDRPLAPDGHMAESILLDLADVVRSHPWWEARTRLILDLLARAGVDPPASVLDAGCGWGTTFEALGAAGYRTTGADISRRALERIEARSPDARLAELDLTAEIPVSIEPRFDAVLALDVIEHVDDDRGAVRRLARLVGSGGVLVVTVPALPELFGEFDEVQGHRRRYLPETLRAAFEGADLVEDRLLWWGAWMVPLLKLSRRKGSGRRRSAGRAPSEVYADYLKLPPWPAPGLFRWAHRFEHERTLRGKLRSGTSLVFVGRKPGRRSPEGVAPANRGD